MASVVGWLDYSEEQRQRMREIIDLFKDENTIDEIGIGSIRDTFSELLFPGLSTIQTRARYFLFIPWVYRRLEIEKVSSANASAKARQWQTDLISSLERGGARGSEGIIGWDARKNLLRLPSAVYWAGLKTFGIRHFNGSVEDYHRSLDSFQRYTNSFTRSEGDEVVDTFLPNWTAHLPPTPPDLWRETSIELAADEAQFLSEQVALYCSESLLSHYLENPTDLLREIEAPWHHPAAATATGPAGEWLAHARLFSEVMHGAALAYNVMLAERAREVELPMAEQELDVRYSDELEDWASDMREISDRVSKWDIDEMWTIVRTANPRVPPSAEAFARRWIAETMTNPDRLVGMPTDIRTLIRDRELRLKRGRARLHHHRALEMWSGSSGLGRLNYRWPTAKVFIGDIHRGLGLA